MIMHSIINKVISNIQVKLKEAKPSEEQGMQEVSEVPADNKTKRIPFTASDIVNIVVSGECSKQDVKTLSSIFREILVKYALVDDVLPISSVFSKITPMTAWKLLGEYLVNFPVAGQGL